MESTHVFLMKQVHVRVGIVDHARYKQAVSFSSERKVLSLAAVNKVWSAGT